MPQSEVIHLRPLGWENDPEHEYIDLPLLDYCVAQVYTNFALIFKDPETDNLPAYRKRVVETFRKGLEHSLSQLRPQCGNLEQTPDGSVRYHKRREDTVEFHVQYLDEPGDEGKYPSFADLEAGHFSTKAMGNIDNFSIPSMTYGEKPEATMAVSPKVAAYKLSFIRGGMVFVMIQHHKSNDIFGWSGSMYQIADNCRAYWQSYPDTPKEFPPWSERMITVKELEKPTPEKQIEAPPAPDKHPDHVPAQWVSFHLPKSKAAELKKLSSPTEEGLWISTLDAAMGYIWRMLSKHRAKIFKPDLSGRSVFGEACNMRCRLRPKLSPRTQGNIVTVELGENQPVPQPTIGEVISEAPLSRLALFNRALTNHGTPEQLHKLLEMIATVKNKDELLLRTDGFAPMAIFSTDWRDSDPYNADFGFGKPYGFRFPFDTVTNNLIIIYPERKNAPPAGADEGSEYLIAVEKEITQDLIDDPEWNKFFEFRFIDV